MGIREHLSKKVDEKEMKLSDLSFDMPEKQDESEFDVERDVSERMKSSLLSRLKETRPSGFNVNARINAAWDSFISNASKMKTLFPEEVDGLDFNQEQLEGLKARLIYIGKHRGDTEFLKFAQGLRGVLGNNFDKTELPSRLNKKMIKRLKSDIAKVELDPFQASYSSCVVLMENLVNYKIAWLDQFESLDIGDGLFERLKSDIESWRTNDIVNFCYIASAVRILFPERFDEISIDKADWKRMKEVLEKGNGLLRHARLNFLVLLSILAAEKVWVSDQGLELQMKEKKEFKAEKKPRPERKSF